jgi:transcriptional regulator with GAF, ATPase, and Fis domain
VNPFFSQVAGVPRDQLIGQPLRTIVPEWNEEPGLRSTSEANGEDPLPGEANLVTATGDERCVLWSNVAVSEGFESEPETLTVGVDFTEQRRAEAARDLAVEQLEVLKRRLEEENLYLREEIRVDRDYEGIVGQSDALLYVLHRVGQVAPTDSTVLIQGETGVGKELVARAIHEASDRSDGPFVRLNCANLPTELVESELFGHEAGAFTGATRKRRGRFELANGGTILLDEIAELPLELQGKLLRVLQEGEFEPIGGSQTQGVDVRVLAATNRELDREVEEGRFRADLFYRINVYPVTVPPLRERQGDIPLLAKHFVVKLAKRMGREIGEIPAGVMRELNAYDWPGNVRELQNVIERAVITSPGPALRLANELAIASVRKDARETLGEVRLRSLREVEREHVLAVLDVAGGRVAGAGGAAEVLGLHPNTLRSRMKKLGIEPGAGRVRARESPTPRPPAAGPSAG